MKKCSLIIFSPTGGTAKAAAILANDLADETETVDLCEPAFTSPGLFARDELAIIAAPSFGGRLPTLAAERLETLRAEDTPCVLLCVYGNRAYDDTLAEMDAIARARGFAPIAAVAALAENSVHRRCAAGRPDAADEAVLRGFAGRIREKLPSGIAAAPLVLPGRQPLKKAPHLPMVPRPTSECAACGACAKKCPAGAIDMNDPRKVNAKRCAACLRCVSVCPRGARRLSRIISGIASLALGLIASKRRDCELFL